MILCLFFMREFPLVSKNYKSNLRAKFVIVGVRSLRVKKN